MSKFRDYQAAFDRQQAALITQLPKSDYDIPHVRIHPSDRESLTGSAPSSFLREVTIVNDPMQKPGTVTIWTPGWATNRSLSIRTQRQGFSIPVAEQEGK